MNEHGSTYAGGSREGGNEIALDLQYLVVAEGIVLPDLASVKFFPTPRPSKSPQRAGPPTLGGLEHLFTDERGYLEVLLFRGFLGAEVRVGITDRRGGR